MRVLITHTDLDGLGCAILAIADGLADRVYCVTNADVTKMPLEDDVTITDLYIMNAPDNVTIYDHHDVAVNKGVSDNTRCATRIYYEEVITKHNTNRDKFVFLIDLFDRWQYFNPGFKEAADLNRLFEASVNPRTALVYDAGIVDSPFKSFIEQGLQLLEDFTYTINQRAKIAIQRSKENDAYKQLLKNVKENTDCRCNRYAITSTCKYISQIGNRYLDEHPRVRYILHINGNKVFGRAQTFDLTVLKLKGHPGAASATFSQSTARGLLSGKVCL